MTIRKIWNRLVKTRYTWALEAEVARLRAENRALLNSILGIAGIPPIVVGSLESSINPGEDRNSEANGAASTANASPLSPRRKVRTTGAVVEQRRTVAATPVRHRTWQQVNRMLEFEAIRKTEQRLPEAATAASRR